MELQWNPKNTTMGLITERLAYADIGTTPNFLLGQYNSQIVGLVLNSSALDPPIISPKIFNLLKVQSAHLNMFVGVRVQKLRKGDLCVIRLDKSPVLAANGNR